MCKKNSKIHLCTCSNINKKEFFAYDNLNHPILIKWTLYRFIKNEWVGMDGMLMEPIEEFSKELSANFFSNEMNSKNCFDFDYQPNEGDNIIFHLITYTKSGKKIKTSSQYKNEFISLIYKRKQWGIDVYDPFYNTTEEIEKGF